MYSVLFIFICNINNWALNPISTFVTLSFTKLFAFALCCNLPFLESSSTLVEFVKIFFTFHTIQLTGCREKAFSQSFSPSSELLIHLCFVRRSRPRRHCARRCRSKCQYCRRLDVFQSVWVATAPPAPLSEPVFINSAERSGLPRNSDVCDCERSAERHRVAPCHVEASEAARPVLSLDTDTDGHGPTRADQRRRASGERRRSKADRPTSGSPPAGR